MTIDDFWKLIDDGRDGSPGESPVARLEQAIVTLPPKEIVSFEGLCWDLMSISYLREIWAVATVIQPSCSQAHFDAARAWIILQGKHYFDLILAHPELLADEVPRGTVPWFPEGERLLRLVPRVYRKLTGEDLPTLPRKVPYVLKGERWTEFDLPDLYPALWKKYRE